MNGLKALWNDYISKRDYQVKPDSHYRKVQLDAAPYHDKVWGELSKEGKKALDEYFYKQCELNSISEGDCFIRGFRMGAHIMFDLMGKHNSDFIPMDGEAE